MKTLVARYNFELDKFEIEGVSTPFTAEELVLYCQKYGGAIETNPAPPLLPGKKRRKRGVYKRK